MTIEIDETWRYVLDHEYELRIDNYLNIKFESEWFTILGDTLKIKKGYAWNGCNPAYRVESTIFGISFWVGTPDGTTLPGGMRQTWEASMVHDAFCQYREVIHGVTKKFTIDLFKALLLKSGFSAWRANFYAGVVNYFGPQDWK